MHELKDWFHCLCHACFLGTGHVWLPNCHSQAAVPALVLGFHLPLFSSISFPSQSQLRLASLKEITLF